MKKMIALLLACLVLAGCSDAYASINNANETVFSVAGTTMTRGDLYNYMQAQDGGYTAVNMAMENILNAKIEVTEEMNESVESTITMYESLLGENFESYIMSMGYASLDHFKADLMMNEQSSAFAKQFIEENFDDLCSTYAPRKVKIATFKDQTLAGKAQAALKDGADYEETLKSFESTSTSYDSIIYTTKSSYPTTVTYAVSTLTDGQVSDVIANTDETLFYVVVMEATNPADFKDEAVAEISAIDTIASDAMLKAFNEAGFAIYDKNLHDAISTNYPDYLPAK
ncbi:MAG: peptidyl-prolyl cis-trans isomerase [Erysipelotrichaceae bacterium]|nr:peptidyl-prolyl cis-trans isomerase [Erysipelotrichaceae bacterium]